jgi:hypothetical protein
MTSTHNPATHSAITVTSLGEYSEITSSVKIQLIIKDSSQMETIHNDIHHGDGMYEASHYYEGWARILEVSGNLQWPQLQVL